MNSYVGVKRIVWLVEFLKIRLRSFQSIFVQGRGNLIGIERRLSFVMRNEERYLSY